jgi:hypothetical protein
MTTTQFVIEDISVRQSRFAERGEKWNAVGTRSGRATISVNVKDESVMENLMYRKSRPTKLYRDIIKQVRDQIQTEHNINLSEFVWSQTAFCSCGCSPAFLVLSDRGWSIDITVSGIAPVVDAVAVDRAAQFGVELQEAN